MPSYNQNKDCVTLIQHNLTVLAWSLLLQGQDLFKTLPLQSWFETLHGQSLSLRHSSYRPSIVLAYQLAKEATLASRLGEKRPCFANGEFKPICWFSSAGISSAIAASRRM